MTHNSTVQHPVLETIYLSPTGKIEHFRKRWNRPCTREALQSCVDAYIERVAEGYIPPGFDYPPIPHCLRIYLAGRLLAEWLK